MVFCEGTSLLDVIMGKISGEVSHLVEEHGTPPRIHSIKHEAFTQCCFNIGTRSTTLAQHKSSIGWYNVFKCWAPSTTLAQHTSSIGSTYDMGWRGTGWSNIPVYDAGSTFGQWPPTKKTAGLMLGHRLWRWPSINPALYPCLVLAGDVLRAADVRWRRRCPSINPVLVQRLVLVGDVLGWQLWGSRCKVTRWSTWDKPRLGQLIRGIGYRAEVQSYIIQQYTLKYTV